jgi:hypothetical protein
MPEHGRGLYPQFPGTLVPIIYLQRGSRRPRSTGFDGLIAIGMNNDFAINLKRRSWKKTYCLAFSYLEIVFRMCIRLHPSFFAKFTVIQEVKSALRTPVTKEGTASGNNKGIPFSMYCCRSVFCGQVRHACHVHEPPDS